MKNQKGLGLIGTIFLVIIIAIVVFAVVYFIRLQTEKEALEDLKIDMLLVQAKVKTIAGDYTLEDEDTKVLQGTKLSEMEDQEEIKEFLEKELFDPEEKGKQYYVLNQEDLNNLELTQVQLEEGTFYIVEYTQAQVYITKGFEYVDGNTYYEIKEIENLEVEE